MVLNVDLNMLIYNFSEDYKTSLLILYVVICFEDIFIGFIANCIVYFNRVHCEFIQNHTFIKLCLELF